MIPRPERAATALSWDQALHRATDGPSLSSPTSELNHTLNDRTPDELLRWAAEIFGSRLALISAMQMAGSVVCHMVSQLKLGTPVLFVDTGVNFQETLATRDRIASEYGLTVHTLHPTMTMEEQTSKLGILYLTSEGQEECCHMRKVEPLLTQKGKYDCLIGSLRRADGGKRGVCPIIAVDPEMNAVRLNPLANMTNEVMDAYIKQHQVIVNPLHYQGFSTIGCNRCTTPFYTARAQAGRAVAPSGSGSAVLRNQSQRPGRSDFRRHRPAAGSRRPHPGREDRLHDLMMAELASTASSRRHLTLPAEF